MDPFTIASIGIQGLGAIQGMRQGNAQAQAARDANNINMLQFLEQRRQATLGAQQAEEGSTDARGNRVRYVPGRGWVTTLSDGTQRLINASDTEEYQRNTGDAATSRTLRQTAANRQFREGSQADAMLAQRGVGGRNLEGVQSALLASKAARAMAGNRAMQRGINMSALRQGTGGEAALAELGRSGREDVQTAIADARLEANPQFLEERAAREGANDRSYAMFAGRATNPIEASFRPTQVGDMSGATNSGMAALAQARANAQRVQAPQLGFAEDRTPVAIAGIGSAVGGLGSLYNAYNKQNSMAAIPPNSVRTRQPFQGDQGF